MSIWDNIHEKLNDAIRAAHSTDLADQQDETTLIKSGGASNSIKRVALVDPNLTAQYGGGGYGLYKPRFSHISFKTLKEMSLRDPVVAGIMQTRINQISAFARPQASRYDTGFKIVPIDENLDIERGSKEEVEIAVISDYILNTGVVDDNRDPDDRMDFDTWLKMVVRDRLTYGVAAIETVRDLSGKIYAFLPVPTETVFLANTAIDDSNISSIADVNKQSFFTGAEKQEKEKEILEREKIRKGEYKYVQVIEGRVVEGFTRQELIYSIGNPQNFIDSNGYPIPELEMATTTITSHLQASNYNKMFFTHGFAARGLLHIVGDVTPAQLQAFRAQWYSQVSGNSNSWRTPIIAGVDEVRWLPLSANNREMEYTQYTDHIIRILCMLFQISPIELGLDYLTRGAGQGLGTESNNERRIEESQSRGLRPLLTWLESIMNTHVLPGAFPELADKYKFCFVGLDAESKEQELQRQSSEVGLHTCIDDIRKELDKDPILAGKVILNPSYIEFLFRTHTIGEIRENLLGYAGDAQKPEFQYIPDPHYMQNRMELSQPAGGVDEDGNPVEGGIGPMPGGEMGDGQEIQDLVTQYLEEHPEVVEKSLMKSVDPTKTAEQFDKLRTDYLKVQKEVERRMLSEILESVKEDIESNGHKPKED